MHRTSLLFLYCLFALLQSCAHTGPPASSAEEAALSQQLEKEAAEYQQHIQKHPQEDLQRFNYTEAWISAQDKRLNRVVSRLCKANGLETPNVIGVVLGKQWSLFGGTVYILNAGTDGSDIFVTAAMMKLLSSDEELAAVVGHELAHIDRGHLISRILRSIPAILARSIAEAYAPGSGRSVDTLSTLALAEFDRDEEREADVYGMIFLKKAGYNYHRAPRLWRKMSIIEPQNMRKAFYFGDSHPYPLERLIRLQKIVKDFDAGQDPIKKYLPSPEEKERKKEIQTRRRERRRF